MRYAFGLFGLLITIGVIVWILHSAVLPHTQAVLQTQRQIRPEVEQLAGKGENGEDARKTISLAPETTDGTMTSVLVTAIEPDGAMAKYFGLQKGDSITEIAPQGGVLMPVKGMSSTGDVKDQLLSCYQHADHITIVRGGVKMTLPVAGAGGSNAGSGTALQRQLESITKPR